LLLPVSVVQENRHWRLIRYSPRGNAATLSPRSTVGTITEIHDYLRLMFARIGTPRCPEHQIDLSAQTVTQMVDQVLALPEGSRMMLLAPVVQDRKGEHTQMLAELRAQGYLRVRVDGEVHALDDNLKLDARKKHTVEAVIDRFRIKEDLRLRLAESLETTLGLADGIAILAPLQDGRDDDTNDTIEEILFSSKYSCPVCSHAVTELTPRLFSFNSPQGACGTCDGLGGDQFIDENKVITDTSKSLADGAIRGWDKRNTHFFQMMQSLAAHYDFDVEAPFKKLAADHQKAILYGSGKSAIQFNYKSAKGRTRKRKHKFEGVLITLERRYRETESTAIRAEIGKYLSSRPCASCNGSRLNEAARNVFIDNHPISEVSALSMAYSTCLMNHLLDCTKEIMTSCCKRSVICVISATQYWS